jgi:hypothetical protein
MIFADKAKRHLRLNRSTIIETDPANC